MHIFVWFYRATQLNTNFCTEKCTVMKNNKKRIKIIRLLFIYNISVNKVIKTTQEMESLRRWPWPQGASSKTGLVHLLSLGLVDATELTFDLKDRTVYCV